MVYFELFGADGVMYTVRGVYAKREGYKWCSGCKKHVELSFFHKSRNCPDGLQPRCYPCNRSNEKARLERREEERLEAIYRKEGGL